jgi:hypothetical protein
LTRASGAEFFSLAIGLGAYEVQMNTKALDAFGGVRTETVVSALRPADTILIYTANSTYSFSLIDPVRGFGILTGGVFGKQIIRATLIGLAADSRETDDWSIEGLIGGASAIFLIGSSKGVTRVRTSPITKVVRVCMDDGAPEIRRAKDRDH